MRNYRALQGAIIGYKELLTKVAKMELNDTEERAFSEMKEVGKTWTLLVSKKKEIDYETIKKMHSILVESDRFFKLTGYCRITNEILTSLETELSNKDLTKMVLELVSEVKTLKSEVKTLKAKKKTTKTKEVK